MTERKTTWTDIPVSLERRAFITLTVAMSGPLAGCSGKSKRTAPNQDESTDPSGGSDNPDKITEVEAKIKQVYDRIEDVPLVADGEFVYDLEISAESVDYEEMVKIAKEALKAAEDMDQDVEVSKQTQEYLQRTAKIAFLLVDQRFLFHRALLGGLVFRRAFSKGEYERAAEVIDESRGLLERLKANGGELENEVDTYEDQNLTMSEEGTLSITSDLVVVREILHWWIPVFVGFQYTATGMVVVQEGNQELQDNRYGPAQEHYDQAQKDFTRAEAAFNTAHGRGQPLEYLMPIVTDLRCFVPILATGYDDLDEAFSELVSGNEENGLEIAREILTHLDKEFSRCM